MELLPFEGRWPPQGVGGVSSCQEGTPKLVHFPGQVIPLRRASARHLPSKGRIFDKCNCPSSLDLLQAGTFHLPSKSRPVSRAKLSGSTPVGAQ
jgi:hypothetical protein